MEAGLSSPASKSAGNDWHPNTAMTARLDLRLLAAMLICVVAGAAEVRVNEAGQIEARGAEMRVFRGDAATPLFGGVTHAAGMVRFVPTLSLVPGETYRVEFQAADGSWSTQRLRFELPQGAVPTVTLAPSPAVLPANALKLYLHFSHPMEQGVFLERITLHRQDGSVVHGAFRETELWSPDGERLTLWLHPGRQKTGVNLNTDEGPVLREGENHTLKIATTWRSVDGVPLGKEWAFPLQAIAADHACPDLQRWDIAKPKVGTRTALRILFDEPLDPAMLYSALQVRRGDQAVKGAIHVPPDARSWSFIPAAGWQAGVHEVVIDSLLEDLAGNNLLQPFEVDRDVPVKAAQKTTLRFELRQQPVE